MCRVCDVCVGGEGEEGRGLRAVCVRVARCVCLLRVFVWVGGWVGGCVACVGVCGVGRRGSGGVDAGTAWDCSGDPAALFRWFGAREPSPLPLSDSRVLPLLFLPSERPALKTGLSPLLTPRFLNWRAGGLLDWHERSTQKLGKQDWWVESHELGLRQLEKTWRVGLDICNCACLANSVRQVHVLEYAYLQSHQDGKSKVGGPLRRSWLGRTEDLATTRFAQTSS